MTAPTNLEVTCDKCAVSGTCSRRGSSPLYVNGVMKARCYLIGGYGRTAVDKSILSKESLERTMKEGECLTLAMIPSFDIDQNQIIYGLVKIFAPPVLHKRETTDLWQDRLIPKNHNG